MKIICTDVKPISDELAIDKIEDKYDIDFSKEFKTFFLENNGGIPINNIFEVNGKEYEIRCFLSFNKGEYNSINIPLASFWEETKGKIIPIAKDSSDCYYCINIENGKVYFWDKDDNLYYCIAQTLPEFLEIIQ